MSKLLLILLALTLASCTSTVYERVWDAEQQKVVTQETEVITVWK